MLGPAETTSVTALKFAEVLQDAGLSPGVVSFVTGAGETGAAVVEHPDPVKIAFTGSTEVGKTFSVPWPGAGKKLTLELGGKAANIIFDDAPLDQAVEGIVNGIFFNQARLLRRIPSSFHERGQRSSQNCATASGCSGWAIRWIRTPMSAPSTPGRSSTRSGSW